MVSFSAYVSVWWLLFIVVSSNEVKVSQPPKVFDVRTYGAVADGNTDNAKAFLEAWNEACQWKGRSRVLIPEGTYMLSALTFKGPCNGPMSFINEGVIEAPISFDDHWISFQFVDQLVVKGGGTLDGQGSSAWRYNDCFRNSQCKILPATLRFDFVNNSRIQNLRSINSKNMHINLFACNNMNITKVRLTAPGDSPNTDGIHIGCSTNIKISRVVIGTGDDCISIITGSNNIDISDVTCGPGHGISVGSLGKGHDEDRVTGVTIRNITFNGTENGVRIKTWAPSEAGVASDFTFENLRMNNVRNPIIIDQQYCPQANCDSKAQSSVQINNVTFNNIWGVSSSKVAVVLKCSETVPCQNIKLTNIDLDYNGSDGPVTSMCLNVNGESSGRQSPPSCL